MLSGRHVSIYKHKAGIASNMGYLFSFLAASQKLSLVCLKIVGLFIHISNLHSFVVVGRMCENLSSLLEILPP